MLHVSLWALGIGESVLTQVSSILFDNEPFRRAFNWSNCMKSCESICPVRPDEGNYAVDFISVCVALRRQLAS